VAGLRRSALGTAGPKPASQDVVLNVSKVVSNSSAGAPGIGQERQSATVSNKAPRPHSRRLGSRGDGEDAEPLAATDAKCLELT
jgi:hypothetical protein